MASRKRGLLFAAPLAGVLVLAACGGDDDGDSATTEAPAETDAGSDTTAAGGEGAADVDLSGVCPETVVFQTDWNPESEHGQLYQMVGDGYEVDAGSLRVTGPLVTSGGADTGVQIQVRAGGPAIGFQTVTSQLYADPDIMLGYVSTDEAIQNSSEFPTKAVVAPFNKNPQIIMWDPETYPDVETIADLGETDAKVRYFGGAAYMEYLLASGQLTSGQVDGNYDGTPANFVADGGASAQQGFASAEPYFYEQVLEEWGKPVAYQLIHDAGWTAYAQSLAGTPETVTANADCLAKLVPIIQQAQVDYINDPAETNELILALVEQYNNGWVYDAGQAAASVELQLENELVANSPDGTLGSFDLDRVTEFIATAVPIFESTGAAPVEGLTAEDLVTNEFIDPSISL